MGVVDNEWIDLSLTATFQQLRVLPILNMPCIYANFFHAQML